MPAPTALEVISTGSTTTNVANLSSQEGATTELPVGVSLSDRIGAAPAADRAALAADDTATTDMSTVGFAGAAGANLFNINNRGALAVWCEFPNAAGSATVRIIYYDSSDNPLFVGEALTFAALAQRVSAAGDYMSEPRLVDSYGASQYRPYLSVKGTGNVDIFAHPI